MNMYWPILLIFFEVISVKCWRFKLYPNTDLTIAQKMYSYRVATYYMFRKDQKITEDEYFQKISEVCNDQRVARDGYKLQSYKIMTKDYYILTIYRIFNGTKPFNNTGKSPVLLVHGMGANADLFFLIGKESLPYYLVDNGYDVWVLNARGGRNSQGHKYYDLNKDKDYWNFSFHEIALYDLTANIDFVIKKTKQKVFVIGHSQGNTCLIALLCEKPEYNDKLKLGVVYAASMKFSKDNPILTAVAYIRKVLQDVWKTIGLWEFLPHNSIITIITNLCKEQTYFHEFCTQIVAVIGNSRSKIIDPDLIPVMANVAGLNRFSMNQILHFMTCMDMGDFVKYDHGPEMNQNLYKNVTPPKYDLKKVTAPIAFFQGDKDFMGSEWAVNEVVKELPNVILVHKIEYEHFNHIDFIFGKNASKLVYEHTVKLFQDIDNKLINITVN